MTASDVREKDLGAANKWCSENIGLFSCLVEAEIPELAGIPAFLAGIQHARSEQEGLVAALEEIAPFCSCREEGCLCSDSMAEIARKALAGWRKNAK